MERRGLLQGGGERLSRALSSFHRLGHEGEVVKAMLQLLPASASALPVSCSNSSSHHRCCNRRAAVVKAMLQRLPVSASHVPMSPASGGKLGTFIGTATGGRIDRRYRKFTISAEQRNDQFEIDRAKAKEALKDLDQQLLSLSQKQIPKTRFLSSVGTFSLSSPRFFFDRCSYFPYARNQYLDN